MSLQGTLRTLGITEVLEFLADRKATGRLDIDAGSGRATYWMFRGDVNANEYLFQGEQGNDPAEATYYALSELDGTFIFDEDEAPPLGEPVEDVPSVLARTAAIAERWAEIQQDIPSVHHVLCRNTEIDGSVTIQPEWWKAIELVGSGTTCKSLAVALDLDPLSASTMAHEMLEAGLLVVSEDIEEATEGSAANGGSVDEADAAVIEQADPAFTLEDLAGGSEPLVASPATEALEDAPVASAPEVAAPRTLAEISLAVEELTGDDAPSAEAAPDPVLPEPTVPDPTYPESTYSAIADELAAVTHEEHDLDPYSDHLVPEQPLVEEIGSTSDQPMSYETAPAEPPEPAGFDGLPSDAGAVFELDSDAIFDTLDAPTEPPAEPQPTEAEPVELADADDGWASDHSKPTTPVRLAPRPLDASELPSPTVTDHFAAAPTPSGDPFGAASTTPSPFEELAPTNDPFADTAPTSPSAAFGDAGDDPLESFSEIIPQTSRFVGLPEPTLPGPPTGAPIEDLPGVMNDDLTPLSEPVDAPPAPEAGGLGLPPLGEQSGDLGDLGGWQLDETFAPGPPPPAPESTPVDQFDQLNELLEDKDDKKGKEGGLGRFLRRD